MEINKDIFFLIKTKSLLRKEKDKKIQRHTKKKAYMKEWRQTIRKISNQPK